MKKYFYLIFFVFSLSSGAVFASSDSEGHCSFEHGEETTEYDSKGTAFHHIADANVYSIGPLQIPLPCILYAPETGFDFFLSSKFDFKSLGHGTGHKAYNRYVLNAGTVMRVVDDAFPMGSVELEGFSEKHVLNEKGKEVSEYYTCYDGHEYKLDVKSTADGGLFGGGITSYYDFSITKNVFTMLIVLLLCFFLFRSIKNAYQKRDGMAPKGTQSFIEPIFLFIQDEVCKPFLGNKWEKYQPFIMSLFFFILLLNLFGQIPFFGGSNVTGNLAVTAVLAIFTFIVTTVSGNRHYWEHVLWMPGVPAGIKAVILTPVEILGLFIKPFTLMLRLFANMTAGHIVVMSFVGLIFIFGKMGTSTAGWIGGAIVSIPLTIFMMAIELLVAFIQAFVFAILTASYIGAAIEDNHH